MSSLYFLVGVSGFEPEASWTRTKRDTKLRHTPIISFSIIMKYFFIVKCQANILQINTFVESYYRMI